MVAKLKAIISGKHLQLDGSLVWPKPIAQAILLRKFCGYQLIRENHKTFPLQTIFNIWYSKHLGGLLALGLTCTNLLFKFLSISYASSLLFAVILAHP